MIIVDDDCCRNCGPLWTIMSFCGLKHGSTNPGCEFHCFKHVQLITWTSDIWDIAGFSQHSKLNRSFIVWTEISPFSSLGSSYDFMMEESRAKERINSYPKFVQIFLGPKTVGSIFTWKKFALKFRVNSLLALGMCPVCPCVRVSWSAALNPFQNHGSGVFFGGGASGWGPWEILNFDSCESVKFRLKKTRFEESEMVGTCLNGFLFCSFFSFFSQGFRISMFQSGNMGSEDNFWVLKRRPVGQESNGFFQTESISRSPEYQIFKPTKIKPKKFKNKKYHFFLHRSWQSLQQVQQKTKNIPVSGAFLGFNGPKGRFGDSSGFGMHP